MLIVHVFLFRIDLPSPTTVAENKNEDKINASIDFEEAISVATHSVTATPDQVTHFNSQDEYKSQFHVSPSTACTSESQHGTCKYSVIVL